jgi:hypothetical protein
MSAADVANLLFALVAYRYLPSMDTYNRLMYHIQVFVAHGMYVMLDYQVRDLRTFY